MLMIFITSRYSHFTIHFSSSCQRQCGLLPSLGFCRLSLTFYILIFTSETPRPNELKLGMTHLWKVLSRACTFCDDLLPNMDTPGNSWFWLADFFKSSLLKLLGQMNRNLVGSIYGISPIHGYTENWQETSMKCHQWRLLISFRSVNKHYHRCQPLRFFCNCYEFRAKITVLRSTVYLLRISDYCRPGTVPHLNIIAII